MARVKQIVLLQFREDVGDDQIAGLFAALESLTGSIPGIKDYAGGPYASGEGLNHGFTHGFIMTFRDAAARDAYIPHPEHEKVKNALLPLVDKVLAFDFEA